IRQCIDSLQSSPLASQAKIFPLHANLSSDEQRVVFVPITKRKIVVATNVAETSITIDDIVYVVDTGKVKKHNTTLRAASRNSSSSGSPARPDDSAEGVQDARAQVNFCAALSIHQMVAAMDKAISVLEELGAIDQDGHLMPSALLPLDLRLGKMLVLATVFQCLDPILTIAACLLSKPVFLSQWITARARFATEKSDILTDAHAYGRVHANTPRRVAKSHAHILWQTEHFSTVPAQNYISATTIRDVTVLRNDLLSALQSAGLVPAAPNAHAHEPALLKALLLAALYPRVARIALPRNAVKFTPVAGGAVEQDASARQWRARDMRGERVWVHPASVLFAEARWRSGVVVSFRRVETAKVFLRDVTEVPLYALLLFGGPIAVDHVRGGLTVVDEPRGRCGCGRGRASPSSSNKLRRLLDAALLRALDGGSMMEVSESPVIGAILTLLTTDGVMMATSGI
ncbi:hypothetical protein EDB84DRAFT_1571247, partial [Lactarius hengduanensis]